MIHGKMKAIMEDLPLHTISGYEWECDNCHYHWAERQIIVPYVESRVIPTECQKCHTTITEDGEVDAQGRPSNHETLVALSDVLAAIDAA